MYYSIIYRFININQRFDNKERKRKDEDEMKNAHRM